MSIIFIIILSEVQQLNSTYPESASNEELVSNTIEAVQEGIKALKFELIADETFSQSSFISSLDSIVCEYLNPITGNHYTNHTYSLCYQQVSLYY